MSLFTSSQFASAAASGTDWRDTAKIVLEQLESAKTSETAFNFGFLYISDMLAENAESILNLFKTVLGIENWIGGVGLGVCGCGQRFIDQPAITAMIGRFEKDAVKLFPPFNLDPDATAQALGPWLKQNDPMLVLVHGDPMAEEDPALSLKNFEDLCGGFILGGLTSSRHKHAQFAGNLFEGGLCGAAFSDAIPVASTLSQGCNAIGPVHTITRSDGHTIIEMDEKPALAVFENDLRMMAMKKLGRDPDEIEVDEAALENPDLVPEEFQYLFKGEVHAALPVSESDQNDYLVRNIIGLDQEHGWMTISQNVTNGERILFVHRDHHSVYEDLSARLIALRKRVEHDQGTFAPKAALYVSCVARAFNDFEGPHKNEIDLIHEIIGDVPMTGFYAGGEISKARLYGYTGILTLFL